MKKKLIVLFSVLFFVIAIFVVGMFFFYVFQFKDYNEKPLQISSFSDEIQDENFAAIPTDNVKTYLISPKLMDLILSSKQRILAFLVPQVQIKQLQLSKCLCLISLLYVNKSIYLFPHLKNPETHIPYEFLDF